MKPCVTIKQSAASKRKTQADPVTPSAAIKRQKQADPASLVMRGDSCAGALTRQILQGSQQGHSARTLAGDCGLDAAIAKDGSRKRANNVTSATSADASIENMPLAGLETPTKLQKIRRGRHLSVPSSGRKPTNFEAEDQDKPLAVPAAVLAIPHQAAEEEIHPDDEDRASIVVRCASEAGYTSEDQAKVLALMSGYRARHATRDIVTDYDRDKDVVQPVPIEPNWHQEEWEEVYAIAVPRGIQHSQASYVDHGLFKNSDA